MGYAVPSDFELNLGRHLPTLGRPDGEEPIFRSARSWRFVRLTGRRGAHSGAGAPSVRRK